MKMRENMQDIFKLISSDETLLRLLYYKPVDAIDNPLDDFKEDILLMPELEKWAIINDRIKTTKKTNDLDDVPKCRILFYSGSRGSTNNYLLANHRIIFDVIVHYEYEEVDLRLSWICDRINDLLSNSKITGIGKLNFVSGENLQVPNNYVGYRLVYSIGSGNA